MCGISGFCDFTKLTDKQTLVKMTDVLHHRGPDDSGYSFYQNDYANIGLGHRRLSILDLSAHGHQPMAFENLEIVYNGEVYNFKEIRKELEAHQYSFSSDSDTEVIIKAYHKWGIRAVDKFIGMFALVIYDNVLQKLILLRDRAGIKPLYFYQKDELFMFASEAKSFHENQYFQKEICAEGLSLYFQFGYISEPYSIYQYTRKLRAGHYAELDLLTQQFTQHKYWDVIDCYNEPKLNISFAEAKMETEKLLKSACEYRMVSDVPVGMFLSGGYDSTAVTAILQKYRTEKLKTFSIGFNEEKYNEANFAKQIAEYLGTDHTEYYCTQKDAQEILPLISEIWDEPFSDDSVIPTVLVSRLAKADVTVSLSADGGDEIFGGYDKYVKTKKFFNTFNKIPFHLPIANLLNKVNPNNIPLLNKTLNFESRFNKALDLLGVKNEVDTMNTLVSTFSKKELHNLLNHKLPVTKTGFDEISCLANTNNVYDKIMAIDYKTYQVDDILLKVDRATMSVSLEGREPFLDHRVIEFASKLPTDYKIHDGNKKHILKSIVHDYIPKEMMDRPKMGFNMPLADWFGDDLKSYIIDYLDDTKIKNMNLFNVDMIKKLKSEWALDPSKNVDKLWSLLVFSMWYERWMA